MEEQPYTHAYGKLVMNSKEEIEVGKRNTSHQSSLEKLSFKQVDQSIHPTQVHSTKQEFTFYTGKRQRRQLFLCDMAVNVSSEVYTQHTDSR